MSASQTHPYMRRPHQKAQRTGSGGTRSRATAPTPRPIAEAHGRAVIPSLSPSFPFLPLLLGRTFDGLGGGAVLEPGPARLIQPGLQQQQHVAPTRSLQNKGFRSVNERIRSPRRPASRARRLVESATRPSPAPSLGPSARIATGALRGAGKRSSPGPSRRRRTSRRAMVSLTNYETRDAAPAGRGGASLTKCERARATQSDRATSGVGRWEGGGAGERCEPLGAREEGARAGRAPALVVSRFSALCCRLVGARGTRVAISFRRLFRSFSISLRAIRALRGRPASRLLRSSRPQPALRSRDALGRLGPF